MSIKLRKIHAPAQDAALPDPPQAAPSRRHFLGMALAAWLGSPYLFPGGARLLAVEEQAVTSREAREEATGKIPWDKLNEETKRKILSVVERPSIYRRMPRKAIDCDPQLYLFLLRNPEVVVNMWQVMGVSSMTAQRTGPFTWKGNDGAGTLCNIELAYGTEQMHIFYSDGFYEGQLFKHRISGRCVLLLRNGYEGERGDSRVDSVLDVFLTIDNAGVDLVAKTLHPLVGKTADTNFAETTKFLSRVSLTAEQNGPSLERLAGKLTKVEPSVREELVKITAAVHEQATHRTAGTRVPSAAKLDRR